MITALVVRTAKLQIIITKCICDSEMWWNWKKNAKPYTVIDHWKKACLSVCSFSLSLICISHMQKVLIDFYLNQLCTLHTQRSFTYTKSYIPYSFTLTFFVFSSICLFVCLSIFLYLSHIQQSRQVRGKLVHQNSLLLFKDFFYQKIPYFIV